MTCSLKKGNKTMAKRVAKSTLNANTLDILNVVRKNAGYQYQNDVPEVTKYSDIPKVGEIICGNPALSNQFLDALINRIALVVVRSATFNNPYSRLKKGYLDFGETVEEIFVGITKAVYYTPEKGAEREFKRTLPDVKSAFHVMGWRVMYPTTIQDEDLRQAFLSVDGVTDMIARIVDSIYTSAEYDEYLLTKYMLIKAISHGKFYPQPIGDITDLKQSAIEFRTASNKLPFMSDKYNAAGVKTTTPKDKQVIFMDAKFNAQFDVDVLASAFNMNKADFMGALYLIDDWDTFDNDRFAEIRAESDGLEEVTEKELSLMKDVKAVIVDEDWFQVYDNTTKFTEKYVASGLYWNYFYHTWKTISNSPFANAIAFVAGTANTALPEAITAEIMSKDVSPEATVFTLEAKADGATLAPNAARFVQTETLVKNSIAVSEYGALIIPASQLKTEITLVVEMGGATYTGVTNISGSSQVGAKVSLEKKANQ